MFNAIVPYYASSLIANDHFSEDRSSVFRVGQSDHITSQIDRNVSDSEFPMESPGKVQDARFRSAVGEIEKLAAEKPSVSLKLVEALKDLLSHVQGVQFGASLALREERRQIQSRLQNFDSLQSEAYRVFTERGWTKLKFPQLSSICELLAERAGLSMDREAKRRKEVLFKWLDDNWQPVLPHLGEVKFIYDNEMENIED
jgi:hypothetical protein